MTSPGSIARVRPRGSKKRRWLPNSAVGERVDGHWSNQFTSTQISRPRFSQPDPLQDSQRDIEDFRLQFCVKFRMDGVGDLLMLLNVLKSKGWNAAFADDAIYHDHAQGVDNPHCYSEPLLSLRQSLEDSTRCMKTLDKIRHHLGKKIRALRRRSMPLALEDGIGRTPDELLAHIFETGHNLTDDSEFSVNVSHVSRRFRLVALKTPALWTRLSIADPIDRTKSFVARSGRACLEVDVGLFNHVSRSGQLRFLKTVKALSSRLSSLIGIDVEMDEAMTDIDLTEFLNLKHLASYDRV